MIFNGDANDEDLCSIADDSVKSNDTSYSLKKKSRNANWGMRTIWGWIFSVYGGWKFDDSNQTDLPEATSELTINKSWFQLPIESQWLFGVSVLDSAGNWVLLKKITEEEINDLRNQAESEFQETAGNPRWYRPLANGFKIYPVSDTTRADGIKISTTRDIIPFTPISTTEKPGFDSLFHEAVAIYMGLRYALDNTLAVAGSLQKQWDGNFEATGIEGGYMKRIKEHYRNKFRQNNPPQVKGTRPGYVDEML